MLRYFILFMSIGAFAKVLLIYGEDSREDIKNVKDKKIKVLSKSVAARVSHYSFHIKDDRVVIDDVTLLKDPWGMAACSDERFADQPTLADCTGFLVGEDLLVTAGHCIVDYEGTFSSTMSEECQENSWIFDYKLDAQDEFNFESIKPENIFRCKEIVRATLDDEKDFALIRLDRKVEGRAPLKLAQNSTINEGSELFIIGHPVGLPMKFSDQAKVLSNEDINYFSANLDTYGGNSGSPVFNARTFEVEGILVRGKEDFVEGLDINGEECLRSNICDENGKNCLEDDGDIDGEHVNRITDILDYTSQ